MPAANNELNTAFVLAQAHQRDCPDQSFVVKVDFCDRTNDLTFQVSLNVTPWINVHLNDTQDLLNTAEIPPLAAYTYVVFSQFSVTTEGASWSATRSFTNVRTYLETLAGILNLRNQ